MSKHVDLAWRTLVDDMLRTVGDPGLAIDFFVTFSRMEYALKQIGFLVPSSADATADWPRLGRDLDAAFAAVADPEVVDARNYLLTDPPKKQVRSGTGTAWRLTQQREKGLELLLVYVKRVRNNLFHGGKASVADEVERTRNRDLVRHSLAVLNACLALHPDLSRVFEER